MLLGVDAYKEYLRNTHLCPDRLYPVEHSHTGMSAPMSHLPLEGAS